MLWRAAFAVACAAVVLGFSANGAAPGVGAEHRAADRPCFGAAARDPERPCSNPALKFAVVPSPSVAQTLSGAPCNAIVHDGRLSVCEFGVPSAQATRTIALVGDSHAGHWRGAMETVARAKGWQGRSITHSSCPLQKALRDLPEPRRSSCIRWKRELFRWFTRHPEVSIVFVSGLTGGSGVVPRPGQSEFATRVDSLVDAWDALPETVEQIVVIRDTPKGRKDVQDCVGRAMAARKRAGRACAQPRSEALDRDPGPAAAVRVGSPRVQTVDLTRYFCDDRRCYPVIGGALVCRDRNHLTAAFSATLGPYLLREIDGLAALVRRLALYARLAAW